VKKGWQTKRLGDFAAAVSTGPFGSILHKSDYVDDGVPLVNPINIVGESIVPDPSKLISEETIKRLSNYVLEEGDIVVGRRGEIGRCAVVGPNESGWVCGTGSFFIRPLPSLDSQFLAHLIRSPEYREQLEKLSTGATMKNLSNTALGDLVVSVPPLAEQQRIVGLLDEAFEGLATAKANAEKNLKNARALFESHLQSVFTQRGPGWVEKTLGDVFTTATGTTPPKNNADFYGDFMPLVKPPELCDEAFDSAPDGLSEAGAAVARTLPAKSILVSCIGNLGKIGMNTVPVAFNQQINAILPDESQAIPEFMFFQSLSPVFKSQLESLASGTTVPIVNKSKFNSVSVVLPPLPIQKPVVAQLSSLREETQRLARLYDRKLVVLEALKKSLLHQAFTGAL
jgi:type I restriction enzyme S subunit